MQREKYRVVELRERRFERGRSGIWRDCEELKEADSERIHRGGDGRGASFKHFGRNAIVTVLCDTLDLVQEQGNVSQVDFLKICRNINVVQRAHR